MVEERNLVVELILSSATDRWQKPSICSSFGIEYYDYWRRKASRRNTAYYDAELGLRSKQNFMDGINFPIRMCLVNRVFYALLGRLNCPATVG